MIFVFQVSPASRENNQLTIIGMFFSMASKALKSHRHWSAGKKKISCIIIHTIIPTHVYKLASLCQSNKQKNT